MKTALAIIAFAALTATASAVEYVTLNVSFDGGEFGPAERVMAASPTSLIEIVAQGGVGDLSLYTTRADGTRTSDHTDWRQARPHLGSGPMIGVNQIMLVAGNGRGWVTLKITSAAEINAVTPSAVLVLPENSTGNFDVIIESSGDLVNWTPFFSQTVNSAAATRFFRTRVTKTPAP